MKFHITLSILLIFITLTATSQIQKKVLFIGNSYTAVNDLPSIVSDMASSTGDVLIYDSNTPGGYRFLNHVTNAITLQKIHSNDWDYVVLQEQSQLPAFPEVQKITELYPYAEALCDTIRANGECSEPMFYMTWGRENGDPSNCPNAPWFCAYESMDDSIRATYIHMAEMYNTELAPAGAVWRYIRDNHPEIDLFAADGSHPSLAGSYAAGCAFYTTIYKKDPTLITWNSTLTEVEAGTIKAAAQTVVYDQLETWDYTINPAIAGFDAVADANTISFTNTSAATDSVFWNFGDSNFSTGFNPTHTYSEAGNYDVILVNYKCGKSDSLSQSITIETVVGLQDVKYGEQINVFPNPASQTIQIDFEGDYRNASYSITDLAGKRILENAQFNSASTIDISQLSAGVYILNVVANGKVFTSKIQKIGGNRL